MICQCSPLEVFILEVFAESFHSKIHIRYFMHNGFKKLRVHSQRDQVEAFLVSYLAQGYRKRALETAIRNSSLEEGFHGSLLTMEISCFFFLGQWRLFWCLASDLGPESFHFFELLLHQQGGISRTTHVQLRVHGWRVRFRRSRVIQKCKMPSRSVRCSKRIATQNVKEASPLNGEGLKDYFMGNLSLFWIKRI